MKDNEIVYSIDGVEFNDYVTIMDELRSNHDTGDEVEIEVGECSQVGHADLIYIGQLVEYIQEMASDKFDYAASDYLSDMTCESEDNLKDTIVSWLDKNVKVPNFSQVLSTSKIIVTVE